MLASHRIRCELHVIRSGCGCNGTLTDAGIEKVEKKAQSAGGRAEGGRGSLLLDSSPSGAEVLDGPRRLGETPLEIAFAADRQTLTLRLAKKGFEYLTYTLTIKDVPAVKLKLNPAKSHSAHRSASTPAPPNTGPKVEVLED